MIEPVSYVLGFLGCASVVAIVDLLRKREDAKKPWNLICPLCGAHHTDSVENAEAKLRNPHPNASCATCKTDLTAVWLEAPYIQQFLKTRNEMRVKNMAARAKLESLHEYEAELAAAQAAKEKA